MIMDLAGIGSIVLSYSSFLTCVIERRPTFSECLIWEHEREFCIESEGIFVGWSRCLHLQSPKESSG